MNVLFIGDIVGRPGQEYTKAILREHFRDKRLDLVIANGENSTNGRGLNHHAADYLYDAGVEIITLGNHAWDQRDLVEFIDDDERIVRPANYPEGTPGRGYTICRVGQQQVLIINVMGRTFLSQLDCPFRTVEGILQQHSNIKHVIVDMHAETTSEKLAMGWYFDGRVSAVLGTHTHVQTADERILPGGTGYISDVGMVGPRNGILGMDREAVIYRQRTHMPVRFEVADGPRQFSAVQLVVDNESGKVTEMKRILLLED